MVSSCVVLLSGGLDSSFNLNEACKEFERVHTLTFDYGQKAAVREIEAARSLADHFNCENEIVELSFFKKFTETSLLNHQQEVPTDEVDIKDHESSKKTAKSVWVPNRNGIFLNVAAGFAEGYGIDFVIPGFNLEEAETFPDNSSDFCQAIEKSFGYSTSNHVKIKCYSIALYKKIIVDQLARENFPLEKIWPCYQAGKKWCGKCESCQRLKRALSENRLDLSQSFLNEGK